MQEGQLLGRRSFGGRCGAAGSPDITGTACVNVVGGARHYRQAAPQLHREELGLFGSHRGRLTGMCRDPWHVACLPSAPLGPGTAAHHRGPQWCLSPAGVECVLFNEEYMNCTWGSRETLTANYSLYYW